ncbi:unnamed protein product [Malus baccata var. baccata]
MESSQSTASAQHGLTQNKPRNATEQASQSKNQIEPLELEDTEEEVEHVNNKRPKPGHSFVWDHMVRTKKVVDGKAKFIAICYICKAHILAHPNKNGTSSSYLQTTGCAIYQPNQPIILAESIFGNRKKMVG